MCKYTESILKIYSQNLAVSGQEGACTSWSGGVTQTEEACASSVRRTPPAGEDSRNSQDWEQLPFSFFLNIFSIFLVYFRYIILFQVYFQYICMRLPYHSLEEINVLVFLLILHVFLYFYVFLCKITFLHLHV